MGSKRSLIAGGDEPLCFRTESASLMFVAPSPQYIL